MINEFDFHISLNGEVIDEAALITHFDKSSVMEGMIK